MEIDRDTALIERRIKFLIILLILVTPFLRLVLPQMIITGQVLQPLIYLLPVVAVVPLISQFRFIGVLKQNHRPKISFDVYLILLLLMVLIVLGLFATLGVKTKGFSYSSGLANYLYLLATQVKGFAVVVLMIKYALCRKQLSRSKIIIFSVLAMASMLLDAVTGVRSLIINYYVLPFMSYVFVTKGFAVTSFRFLVFMPIAIGLFYFVNPAGQGLFETLARFDMSIPLEISMHYDPVHVVEDYPLENTYFPNVIRPLLVPFMELPEVNPGREISMALGFNAEGSYYAISIFGEAFLNFGQNTVLSYVVVFGVFLNYAWLISLARFFRPFDVQIAVVITLTAMLIVHGFEDYFAVRFLAAMKIFIAAGLANRLVSITAANFVKRNRLTPAQ